MDAERGTITVPMSYTTSPDAHLRIQNHPSNSPTVTPILIATLNRPSKLNAFNIQMIASLESLFLSVDHDPRVKVVVLTGEGRAFSAGIDLTGNNAVEKDYRPSEVRDIGGRLALAMYNCSKTVIVAYNGLAVGIGMTSTLAAGIR
jgi:enoyl-CoA hydratase/carnithine racemase